MASQIDFGPASFHCGQFTSDPQQIKLNWKTPAMEVTGGGNQTSKYTFASLFNKWTDITFLLFFLNATRPKQVILCKQMFCSMSFLWLLSLHGGETIMVERVGIQRKLSLRVTYTRY